MMTIPERDSKDSEFKVISELRLKVTVVGADRSKVPSGLVMTPRSLVTVFVRAQAALELVSVGQTYVVEPEFEPA